MRNHSSQPACRERALGLPHESTDTAWSCRLICPAPANPWARSPRSAAELLPSSIPHPGLVVFRGRVVRRRRVYAVFGRAGLRCACDGRAVPWRYCAGLQPFQERGLALGCFERIVSHVGELAELRQRVLSFYPGMSALYSSAATQIFVPVSRDDVASVHPGDRHCCGVAYADMLGDADMSSGILRDPARAECKRSRGYKCQYSWRCWYEFWCADGYR